MSMKKKGALLFAAGAALSLVVGATAFACTNLATLNLSSTAGKAGDTVTVTGSSFQVGRGDGWRPICGVNRDERRLLGNQFTRQL